VSAYGHLAQFYDRLTEDVDYKALAGHYERQITQGGRQPKLVLDLACGTGTLTRMLAERGYQMIGADASAEMLAVGAAFGGPQILYLQQDLTELDLYGTVDAAICTLDGLNYLPPDDLEQVLRRVFLFLNPGGVFAFDLNTPEKLKGLDSEIFCDEREDLLCLWRCSFDADKRTCRYDFDLFEKQGKYWLRNRETHVQYVFVADEVREMLERAGFAEVAVTGDAERMFFTAIRRNR